MKNIRKSLLAGLIVIVLLAALGMVNQFDTQANANATFRLQAPVFIGVARADPGSITSFIEDEAGISAYFQASSSIALADVSDAFRTIEVETADYIIGSVPVADYPESEDVHVYVHTDGWIVAYYLAADPVGKIFDWHGYDGTSITTKLENTITVIAAEAGVPFTGATCYDFRYPNATHLMLIADGLSEGGTDSFEVNLPGGYSYYERSWSLGSYSDTEDAWYYLNGVQIEEHYRYFDPLHWKTSQGTLTVAQLLPDAFHTIEVRMENADPSESAIGGLALVYKEQ